MKLPYFLRPPVSCKVPDCWDCKQEKISWAFSIVLLTLALGTLALMFAVGMGWA